MKKREEAVREYRDHQLLYNIQCMNTYYQEIPNYIAQRTNKFKKVRSLLAQKKEEDANEFLAYWRYVFNYFQ